VNITHAVFGDPAVLMVLRSGASNARLGAGRIRFTDPDRDAWNWMRGAVVGETNTSLVIVARTNCRIGCPICWPPRPVGYRAAHKNSDLDNELGSVAIRILPHAIMRSRADNRRPASAARVMKELMQQKAP